MSLVTPRDYAAIQTAIADSIAASNLFAPGAKISAAPGSLTESWLSRNAMSKGGALVAIGKLRGIEHHSSGVPIHELGLGVFLVPEPEKREKQAADLIRLVSQIVLHIDENRFGISGAGLPKGLTGRNLYSPSLDKRGSTLWQLDWTQKFHLFNADSELVTPESGVSDTGVPA